MITGNDQETIITLIQNLDKAFAFEDLEQVNYFLGIQVSSLPSGGFHLSRGKYITNLLSRAKMQYAKSVSPPITSRQMMSAYGSDLVQDVLYGSMVDAI